MMIKTILISILGSSDDHLQTLVQLMHVGKDGCKSMVEPLFQTSSHNIDIVNSQPMITKLAYGSSYNINIKDSFNDLNANGLVVRANISGPSSYYNDIQRFTFNININNSFNSEIYAVNCHSDISIKKFFEFKIDANSSAHGFHVKARDSFNHYVFYDENSTCKIYFHGSLEYEHEGRCDWLPHAETKYAHKVNKHWITDTEAKGKILSKIAKKNKDFFV